MSTEPNTSGLKNVSDTVHNQQEKQHEEQENHNSRYKSNEKRMLLQEQERGDEAVHLDDLLPFHPLQEVQEDKPTILHDDDDRRFFQNALLLEPRPIKESNGIKSFVTSGGCGLFDEPMLTTSASMVSSKLPLTAILPQGRNVVVEQQGSTNVFQFPIRFPTSAQDMMVRASKNHSLVGGVFNTYMEDEVSTSHPHQSSKDILSTTPCEQQSDKAAAVVHEFAPLAADNTTNNKIMDCSTTAATSQSSLEQPHNKDHDTLFCSPTISMARDEDCNWLSELQCLIRSDVLEVFVQKTTNDTNSTTSSIKRRQEQPTTAGCPARAGIRCRFCAKQHVRTRRATAFPSEVSKIYQSVSMMLRDHIPKCTAIPLSLQLRLTSLHDQAKQSASGVKQYWEYSALAIGLVDTPMGLGLSKKATRSFFNTRLVESAADKNHGKEECSTHNVVSADILTPAMTIPPFGKAVKSVMSGIPIVSEEDSLDMSPPAFFLEVMKHVELVYLDHSEITAYRRVLEEGHPGFGCIYCGKVGRMGFCRKFPMTKKSLPNKMEEMSNHLSRCSLCPKGVKDHLKDLCYTKNERLTSKMKAEKNDFMDLIWNRLHRQDIHQENVVETQYEPRC